MAKGPRMPKFGNRIGDNDPPELTNAEIQAAEYRATNVLFRAAMRKAHPEIKEGISSECGTVTVYRSNPSVMAGRQRSGWVF